jgi:hypothetical protein
MQSLRYRVGQLFFGRRPFANYLDQNEWGSRLSQAA